MPFSHSGGAWAGKHPTPAEAQERPLDDKEKAEIVQQSRRCLTPRYLYTRDAMREARRIDAAHGPQLFAGRRGRRRKGVLVRHNVKRRWQKLGIWNNVGGVWGIPGRRKRRGARDSDSDDCGSWQWWWLWWWRRLCDPIADAPEDLSSAAEIMRFSLDQQHVAQPRPAPGTTTPADAQAFLASRPWFVYARSVVEEMVKRRRWRSSPPGSNPSEAEDAVRARWRERGDWDDARWDDDDDDAVHAWKWRWESPSPEPEDLGPVARMRAAPLEVAAEMGFTPSETDEMEEIERSEAARVRRKRRERVVKIESDDSDDDKDDNDEDDKDEDSSLSPPLSPSPSPPPPRPLSSSSSSSPSPHPSPIRRRSRLTGKKRATSEDSPPPPRAPRNKRPRRR
ncbi:uncharacterized protein GGS25DRAFT_533576 [Hypoxylon fragiforme]|uniref:uncharacterized protein n=1 Tax=Hypoxylon fragiforme TaxID=63214 RepID=UPI0020C70FD3|nr:uncharacterized protein GGS25DRAFT_533576 [Hypoxylon fragiforme]KAI2606490.1 hypothetical protein GGS25DRAFT_533576 [Hypoxylon fragiforme]